MIHGAHGAPYGVANTFCDTLRWEREFMQRWGKHVIEKTLRDGAGMSENLLITGIPRSGTSYVCALLNNIENTVIVNEPEEIFKILRNGSSLNLATYYEYVRHCINNRIPISNKVINGKYIDDTNKGDVRSYYVPEVSDAAFVFGTKNTLVYLASLKKLREQLPGANIVACVRHPYECISSWKKVVFPHIRNASPLFLRDYSDSPGSEEIVRICKTPELETRYALLWNFLARRIIEYREYLILFRYEDIVADPVRYLSDLYRLMGKEMKPKSAITPSEARIHKDVLSAFERDRIRLHCGVAAGELGYIL